jgi:hypothetical protein
MIKYHFSDKNSINLRDQASQFAHLQAETWSLEWEVFQSAKYSVI